MAQPRSGARLSTMSQATPSRDHDAQSNQSQDQAPTDYLVASRMQRHDLHKLHGLGNDFLVWFRPDVPDDGAALDELEPASPAPAPTVLPPPR